MLHCKSILITGGTGSFGKAFVQYLLENCPEVERIVIFSRDELKQFEMANQFSPLKYTNLRYFLGDVRDVDRVRRAVEGVDVVIHAAALKQVPAAEYNPFEFIKTNVIGAQNIIEASLDGGVRRVVALSTDKAAAPVNLYGATKLCSDKLIVAANNIIGKRDLRLSVVRYGNVMGSRGSVVPYFLKARQNGVLPITDLSMTRFHINLQDGVRMVLWALRNMQGGEIFVPKLPSFRVKDLAMAIAPDCEHQIIGVRPGEKIHEEMITLSDGPNTIDLGEYYAILSAASGGSVERYLQIAQGRSVAPGFSYRSDSNDKFLSVDELRFIVRAHAQTSDGVIG
jgi:UDP-N-acetylglucosamine 4,6-dehydratase (inverting)